MPSVRLAQQSKQRVAGVCGSQEGCVADRASILTVSGDLFGGETCLYIHHEVSANRNASDVGGQRLRSRKIHGTRSKRLTIVQMQPKCRSPLYVYPIHCRQVLYCFRASCGLFEGATLLRVFASLTSFTSHVIMGWNNLILGDYSLL